ncbi:MAG: hypothetical protein IKU10_01050, partial [Clostridia bacterium]|nr:hypothetical protein [Clostridia bacterium]
FVYAVGTYNRFLLFCMRYALPIILITVAIVAPSPFGTIFGVFSTLSAKNMANRYNRNVDTIKPIVLREIEQIKSEENQFISEVNEVNQLLSEAYAFNLIPLQFRKLPYVIYIYEYMATSKQSLEAAMLHSHIEEAVQQITEKLDKIIEQNKEMIRMLRYNLATSSSIVSRLEAVSNDIRLNNHLINVNNYYLHTKLL